MNNYLPSTESLTRNRGALSIAGIYLLIGGLWITFSDRLVAGIATDQAMLTTISIYKGWGYVLVTAVLLFWMVRRHIDTFHRDEERLRITATEREQANEELHKWAEGEVDRGATFHFALPRKGE